MVTGIHHVAFACHDKKEYDTVLHFYTELFHFIPEHVWDGGCMLRVGNSYLEIFESGAGEGIDACYRHIAFRVDNLQETLDSLASEGYVPYLGPKNVSIPCDPPLNVSVAFLHGPMQEIIELFME